MSVCILLIARNSMAIRKEIDGLNAIIMEAMFQRSKSQCVFVVFGCKEERTHLGLFRNRSIIPRPDEPYESCDTYAQNQKAHLSAFLEHGEIEISNNQVENAIRPFVIGRKGWLFADTLQGAEASAIIYSLMETAKANNLWLDDYLLHLLSVLPERAEQSKDFEIDDLLPWSEEMMSWFSAV